MITDSDADEPVKPMRRQLGNRFWTADRAILLCGFALAASAAFYPWYVFFNEDKFGINVAITTMKRDQPEVAGRSIVNAPPNGFSDTDSNVVLPPVGDQLITGTIPDRDNFMRDKENGTGSDQPFPGELNPFRLLHVSDGRAMIESSSGVYVVSVGSLLPDNSRLKAIENRGDEWVLVTDSGNEFGSEGKR